MLKWIVRIWRWLTPKPAKAEAPRRPMLESMEGRRMLSAIAPQAIAAGVPRFDHVVIVVEENHSYDQILGPSIWPPLAFNPIVRPYINQPLPITQSLYLRSLARQGATLANSHALAHPSQPNYLGLFSGSTQGVTTDATPRGQFPGPDLGSELLANGLTFTGYSESLPRAGYSGNDVGGYARRHAPWVSFADVPAAVNQPFTKFPRQLAQLPTVSFVIPNLYNDMHSGTVQRADRWLQSHLSRYARWAKSHNSLLIVTWDEDSGTTSNHIPTILYGAHVRAGTSSQQSVNHYDLLRTFEAMYGLPPTNAAATATPITDVFG
jgi:phosphatidylinositol-3-phosphatase